MFGPPVLFLSLGKQAKHKSKEKAKTYYIIAAVYLIVGLGVCGSIISSL